MTNLKFLGLLAAAIALIVFVGLRIHKTTVTDGELLGFATGMTKAEAFEVLLNTPGASNVRPMFPELFVRSKNLADLPELMTKDAIVIHTPDAQIVIYSTMGDIDAISRSGVGWDMPGEFTTLSEVEPVLRQAFQEGRVSWAFSSVKGYGPRFDEVYVSTKPRPLDTQEPGYQWLTQFDGWFFHAPQKWTDMELIFREGRLVRIVRIRWFAEW